MEKLLSKFMCFIIYFWVKLLYYCNFKSIWEEILLLRGLFQDFLREYRALRVDMIQIHNITIQIGSRNGINYLQIMWTPANSYLTELSFWLSRPGQGGVKTWHWTSSRRHNGWESGNPLDTGQSRTVLPDVVTNLKFDLLHVKQHKV